MCTECYADQPRITPLLHPADCLENHTQYICGTCGRCVCIERDPSRGLQRWNFPFKSADVARLYLRTADYTMKKPCGLYALRGESGRLSYKIFESDEALLAYLQRNPGKTCPAMKPVFRMKEYREYPLTQVRRLTADEARRYLAER